MKTLISSLVAVWVLLLGTGVAHAAGPDYFGIPVKWWIMLIVILLILNLLCCLWRRR